MRDRDLQLVNLAQLLLAPVPAYSLARFLYDSNGTIDLFSISISSSTSPFLVANLLLASSLFLGWLLSLAQRSTWLIDPYWTLIPPLLDAFFRKACCDGVESGGGGLLSSLFSSPKNVKSDDDLRARAATALLLLWSVRLTHSYFRRERWRLGDREDWRYADMREEWGEHWWWWSVVPVYVVQHFLLVGLSLPCYALRCRRCGSGTAWRPLWDSLAVSAALSGLALAFFADSQLHDFVSSREEERKKGKPAKVLDEGLWGLCRHPNYLGETVFHFSLAALAVCGTAFGGGIERAPEALWPVSGALLNTACLAAVTRMTEERTAKAKGRGKAWEEYRSRVPCWLPRLSAAVGAKERSTTTKRTK